MSNDDFLKHSQLARDLSAASAAINRLRNSLVPVHLLPLDVLLLIPTHLASLGDRFRVTFVCSRWRRAFLQHAPLWSQLDQTVMADTHLLATLLERARKSPLDITFHCSEFPIPNLTLLYPSAQRTRNLIAKGGSWSNILDVSAVFSGSLPLLHTLNIEDSGFLNDPPFSSVPTFSLFEGAVNLKEFIWSTSRPFSLPRFVFPNLTTFHLCAWKGPKAFSVSLLLNFLGASPSLQDIVIKINGVISYDGVPQDRVLVLPCVKNFRLTLTDYNISWRLMTHLSCPSVKRAAFVIHSADYSYDIPKDMYLPPSQWNTIVRQYGMETITQVGIALTANKKFVSSITFRSSNDVTLDLIYIGFTYEGFKTVDEQVVSEAFSQASQTIRDCPLLETVRRLSIQGGGLAGDPRVAAKDVGKLFGSMGPLEGLGLYGCDLRLFLGPFFVFQDAIQPGSFPRIKELTIVDPIRLSSRGHEAYGVAIVKLAKSQRARGVPFERVMLPPEVPSWLIEELMMSVDVVECHRGDGDRV